MRPNNQKFIFLYDVVIFVLVDLVLYVLYKGAGYLPPVPLLVHTVIAFVLIFGSRQIGRVYHQIWRYGGIQGYIRLLICDGIACVLYIFIDYLLPVQHVSFAKALAFCCMNTLGSLTIRMVYRYAYKCGGRDDREGAFLRWLLRIFSLGRVSTEADPDSQRIKIAIIGAGSVGVSLAEDLITNPKAPYIPRCFIDSDEGKTNREIRGIAVYSEDEATLEKLKEHHIQEVVFAVPNMEPGRKTALYNYYKQAGFRIKTYDFPSMLVPGSKRQLRDFDIQDLLFRDQKEIVDPDTISYYKGKTILITGGGGSIGSELCRQLAKMQPKQLIILDMYENYAYAVQQELLSQYKGKLDVRVEIVSIANKKGLARVYKEYHPDITINAAAHKHVPLMEKNCIEAVQNNVFGALNVVQCCEEYGCNRFMMVSTDKAVNPTNVMGATKRVCEMIMQAYSTRNKVKCSATRFGNVLGSAGSVIPIFKRQIADGGPITITDKRIIRYFMTIPEAAQLVLESGAMARNGDLFVLDMGKPVKILDLAKNMIELSGAQGIDIVETGLRPGEKLYEELLVRNDSLEKTDNNQIFVEHEEPVSMEQLEGKLDILKRACDADNDDGVRDALKKVVPTYHSPEEVNKKAEEKIREEIAI